MAQSKSGKKRSVSRRKGRGVEPADGTGMPYEISDASPAGPSSLVVSLGPPSMCKLPKAAVDRLTSRLAEAARQWALTDRQRDMLCLVLLGLSNKEIAEQVGRSEATVEAHVTALLRRSGATSRGHLMARFWLELPEPARA